MVGDLLGAGHGPVHPGTFHAVGAEALAGALGQAIPHLVAVSQEGGVFALAFSTQNDYVSA